MAMDEFDFQDHTDEKPKGSLGYWVAFAVVAIAFAAGVALLPAALAHADEDIDTEPVADEFQQEIERTAAEYEKASKELKKANKAVKKNSKRIKELEKQIPEQQVRSASAAREQYKLEQQGSGLLELLLNCDNFYDFMMNLDYISRVSETNMQEMIRLSDMKEELDETQKSLIEAQWEAKERTSEAKNALEAAQEARREAQRRAQEAARAAAEAAAAEAAARAAELEAQEKAQKEAEKEAAEEAEETAEEDATSEESGDSAGKEADTKSSKSADKASDEDTVADPTMTSYDVPTDDGADWGSDEKAFIAEWGSRIDAFLAGSPMEGQGATFARAAWAYGVDPRWSPAIANTESSKGVSCFRPYNAWGWGNASWSSWEEAIDAHVAGLARGYGYSITIDAAQKYCPPNWEVWYNNTLSAMNSI